MMADVIALRGPDRLDVKRVYMISCAEYLRRIYNVASQTRAADRSPWTPFGFRDGPRRTRRSSVAIA